MIELLNVAISLGVLATVGANAWWAFKTQKAAKEATEYITQYRRELTWVQTRLDLLEQARQSQKAI